MAFRAANREGPSGNAIRIANVGVTLAQAKQDLHHKTTKSLSSFSYLPKYSGNVSMLLSVAKHYGNMRGVNRPWTMDYVDPNGPNADGALRYNGNADKREYNVVASSTDGTINSVLDFKPAFLVTITHEKVHEMRPETRFPIKHVDAIIAEGTDPEFFNSEIGVTRASYAAILLNRAIKAGYPLPEVLAKLNEFNASAVGVFGQLNYDSKTKQVLFNRILGGSEGVQVNAKLPPGVKRKKH